MITLDAIVLPDDIWWSDELDWSPVEQKTEYSLEGALLIEESIKQKGRTITLAGSEDRAWVPRSTVLDLMDLAAIPGTEMVLTFGSRTFNVMFRRGDGLPVEARPIFAISPPADEDWYTLILRLMEI